MSPITWYQQCSSISLAPILISQSITGGVCAFNDLGKKKHIRV